MLARQLPRRAERRQSDEDIPSAQEPAPLSKPVHAVITTDVTPRDRCARCPPVFSLLLPCHCLHVLHCISCHHAHFICIHVRLMHPSICPIVRFAIRRSVLLRWSFLPFFRVRVLNISGLDRDFPSGLGLLPVDRLSSFVSFGLRMILQRLTEGPKRPRVCCSPTPLQNSSITHLSHFHALRRRITIVWAKTTPHLDTPSSLYL